MTQFKSGQTVRYKPVGGTPIYPRTSVSRQKLIVANIGPNSNTSESVGMIKDVLTEPGQQAGRNVNASMESPRYEVCRTVQFSWRQSQTL